METVSIVFPIYNEEEVIGVLRARLGEVLKRLGSQFRCEIIAVDDGSTDRSVSLLKEWAASDLQMKAVLLSRNFGQQAALTAGLEVASGDVIITIDSDLQDPPEIIPELLAKYSQGFEVVHTQRISRDNESVVKRFTSWLFYRVMLFLCPDGIIPDSGDFRLLSRKAKNALLELRETHRFFRGMSVWIGFPQTVVKFDRAARSAGTTKFSFMKMARLAWDAASSFSLLPLKLIVTVGFLVSMIGVGYGVYSILRAVLVGDTVRGWTTLIVLNSLLGGAILVGLGVVGLFVGKIYEEVKRRPLYLVREIVGGKQSE